MAEDARASEVGGLTTQGGDSCPVCRTPAAAVADLSDYVLYACSTCGCWSSDALVRGAATQFEPDRYFLNPFADQPRWRRLLSLRQEACLPVARVLDVGCGSGAYLNYLRQHVPAGELAGIELDAHRAAQARETNPGASIHCGDAATVAGGLDEHFDLITMWDVFEHVADPAGLLQKLADRLAPDGWLLIQTIHENSLLPTIGRLSFRVTGGRYSRLVRRTHEAHHLVFFSRQGLDHLFIRTGLRCRESWFSRLARDRMDGNPMVTAVSAGLMTLENMWGNGLFINCILERNR